jgi:hypothetical protein
VVASARRPYQELICALGATIPIQYEIPALLVAGGIDLSLSVALPVLFQSDRYPDGRELTTAEWQRVFREAAELGVLHAGLSGGEPLQRADLPELVAAAREAGLYTNLITSAAGLNEARLGQLKAAGLDNIQISFQSDEELAANRIAGAAMHRVKLTAAGWRARPVFR